MDLLARHNVNKSLVFLQRGRGDHCFLLQGHLSQSPKRNELPFVIEYLPIWFLCMIILFILFITKWQQDPSLMPKVKKLILVWLWFHDLWQGLCQTFFLDLQVTIMIYKCDLFLSLLVFSSLFFIGEKEINKINIVWHNALRDLVN